ncbi:MAG: hypothetical protein WCF18_00780 [Chthoniobacteraceae bacterium]
MTALNHLILVAFLSVQCTLQSQAAIVWNGPSISFSKAAFSDETLAANQDRLTDNVWLTRGFTRGLFNIKTEASFLNAFSPADTEWAFGTTADFASLDYTDWETWAGGPPNIPGIVGKNAVVHLITEDIYLDLKFTFWGVGSTSGGAFSYQRSTVSGVPEPGTAFYAMACLGIIALRRHRYSGV